MEAATWTGPPGEVHRRGSLEGVPSSVTPGLGALKRSHGGGPLESVTFGGPLVEFL
jgi:hypothetical protein